jgi:hypothetical protein
LIFVVSHEDTTLFLTQFRASCQKSFRDKEKVK